MPVENENHFYLELISREIIQTHTYHLEENTNHANHLIYCAKGSCRLKTEEKDIQLAPWSLCYIRRNIAYTLEINSAVKSLIYIFKFSQGKSKHLDMSELHEKSPLSVEFIASKSPVCYLMDREDIHTTVHELAVESSSSLPEREQMISALMCILFQKMARSFNIHGKPSSVLYVSEAKRYIAEHYDEALSVQKIAEHIGISRSYLEILFSKYGNRTITTHINTVRADKAAYLLSSTDMKILDVAIAVGYNNRQHFTRIFQDRYSLSPLQYRKLHTSGSRVIDSYME